MSADQISTVPEKLTDIRGAFPGVPLKIHDVCPTCNRKFNRKCQKYQPTAEMVEILFEMVRVTQSDPKGRKYVRMVETPSKLSPNERFIATSIGIKQNHKMRLLGLVDYVDKNGNPCPSTTPHMKGCYMITQKGWDLLKGLPITPWQIHVQNKRVIMMDEDKTTVGSIADVRDFSYDEWVERGKAVGLPLELPS